MVCSVRSAQNANFYVGKIVDNPPDQPDFALAYPDKLAYFEGSLEDDGKMTWKTVSSSCYPLDIQLRLTITKPGKLSKHSVSAVERWKSRRNLVIPVRNIPLPLEPVVTIPALPSQPLLLDLSDAEEVLAESAEIIAISKRQRQDSEKGRQKKKQKTTRKGRVYQ